MNARHVRITHAVATVVLGALALGFASAPAMAQSRIICQSQNYQYSYCRADLRGARVRMVNELSRGRLCREGSGWGSDRRGIWVDRGCRAEFEIWNRGPDRDRGHGDDGKVIAAGAIGLFLGAMIAGGQSDSAQPIPSWAIGSYQGYNGSLGEDVTMTINPDGGVQGYTRMGEVRGRWIPGTSQMDLEGLVYNITQEKNGLRVTQANNPSNSVSYRRMR